MVYKELSDIQRLVLVVVAATFLFTVYWSGLSSPFILDDHTNFKGIERVAASADMFLKFVVGNSSGLVGRPVSMFSFALNYSFVGSLDPFYFKIVNVAIHFINGVVIYGLVTALMGFCGYGKHKELGAICVAIMWLFTSLHTSTILYAVQRMTQLSALFSLLGLWLYVLARIKEINGKSSVWLIVAAYLCVLLAVLSKENGILLIPFFFMLEIIVFNYRSQQGKSGVTMICHSVIGISGFIFMLRFVGGEAPEFLNYELRPYSMFERVLTESRVLWAYVREIIIPSGVDIGLFHDDIVISKGLFNPLSTFVSIMAWVVVLCLMIWMLLQKKFTLSVLGLSIFLIGHALESTVINLEIYFEHRNYLPSVGLWIFLVDVGFRISKIGCKPYLYLLTSFILVFNVCVIYAESSLWSKPHQQAKLTAYKHPQSYRAQNQWAGELIKVGRYTEAITLYSDIGRAQAKYRPITQVQKLWVYCIADLVPIESAYNLDYGFMKGIDAILYNTAWLYFLDEVSVGRCNSVNLSRVATELEIWLLAESKKTETIDEYWDMTYIWLKIYEYKNGKGEALIKAGSLIKIGGVKAAFYAVDGYLSMGEMKKAKLLYQEILINLSGEKKLQYAVDIQNYAKLIGRENKP